MKPKGYQITKPVPGFAEGTILNVTERYRHWHRNEMELELISGTPGSMRVIVTEKPVGFSERNILDPTARFGDWHTYRRTFAAGDGTFTDAMASDGLVQITPKTLSVLPNQRNQLN